MAAPQLKKESLTMKAQTHSAPVKKSVSKPASKEVIKKPLEFSPTNIALVQGLASKGWSYRKIAKELNKTYVTKVKRKRITNRTIANLLQSDTAKTKHYTDSDIVHAPKQKASKVIANASEVATFITTEEQKTEVVEIMNSNLSEGLKMKCIKILFGQDMTQ